MGVAVLQPQNCLKDPFVRNNLTPPHMKYPRNPNPSRPKRPQPNRRRRSPPPPPSARASPPPAAPKVSSNNRKNNNNNNSSNNHLLIGQVRILKRGDEIARSASDLAVIGPDLGSTRRIGPEPEKIPSHVRLAAAGDPNLSPTSSFYAGPVTLTSPPPSELPVPAFFTKKSVSVFRNDDATTDLRRILRLDIA